MTSTSTCPPPGPDLLADSAAGVVAARYAGGPAVTAAMDEMVFVRP